MIGQRLECAGGKGAFLKEIEQALLAGEIDLAVHSLKDMPVECPAGLCLCGVLERGDARDALVSASGAVFSALPAGARVGTTSLRRRAQLRSLRPDIALMDLRGNVDTRLARLREGRFDAIVVAMAGLVRLGRAAEATAALDPDEFLPAPGQGAIALECRVEDSATRQDVAPLGHAPTERAVAAERALLAAVGGGCNLPLAAYAEETSDGVRLRALVGEADGSRLVRGEETGADPVEIGRHLAQALIAQGADEMIRNANRAIMRGGEPHADD
jgi:hydroxymethylbilane synthase